MNKLYIGRVVGTHGIKGEIKVFSDNEAKDRSFIPGNILYFGDSDQEYKIESVRIHKGNYLVLLEGFYNINDVLFLNKNKVYINREDVLKADEYVLDDLIGFKVINNEEEIGEITDYQYNGSYATFLVEGKRKIYLPNVPDFVVNIDLNAKKVYTKNVGELML